MTSFRPKIVSFEDFIYTGTKNDKGRQGKIVKPPFEAQLENIPDELTEWDQWVVWSLIEKKDSDKISKLPTRKVGNKEIKNASLSYPMSYTKAVELYKEGHGVFAGLGFVFTKDDPFIFIDLDGVKAGDERNKFADTDTFVEFSQSGNGLHIICNGELEKAHKPISGEVEIYSSNRFCAITGVLAGKKLLKITEQQGLIDTLIDMYPQRSDESSQSLSRGFQLPEAIPEGNRNNVMWQFCCSLAHKNIQASTMLSRALTTNQDICHPPLEEAEVNDMMERAIEFVAASRRERLEEAEEVDLLNRYALITTNDKFFDLKKKLVCLKTAIDSQHLDTHPGGMNNPPVASRAICQSRNKHICDGLVWYPQPYGSDQLFVNDLGLRLANTWRGFTVTPRKGNIEPWLTHLKFLFPDPEYQKNVIAWLAFMLQHPNVKCNWQLIIQGDEGAGKDALFTPISQILGTAASVIDNKDVRGDFDDGLVGTKFITFSEARRIRDDAVEYLKRISASENTNMFMLNPKKKDKVAQHNLWALAIITNHSDAIKLSPTERRFYVLSSEDRVMTEEQKEAYFRQWLVFPESLAALFHYLLEVNLDSFDPNTLPARTEYMGEMIEATNNDMEDLLTDWNLVGINSFAYDVIHPEWIKRDLSMHDAKFSMGFIKKWLKKNGWVKPQSRPIKTIKGKTSSKSTLFFVRSSSEIVSFEPTQLFNEIEKVERLVEDAAKERYTSNKMA